MIPARRSGPCRALAGIAGVALALAVACPAAAAPVCVDPGGIGGTGAPKMSRPGGIGGTGAPVAANPGGVGGTGALAAGDGGIGGTGHSPAGDGGIGGTGIVGTITGFASICVNGLEVHFDDSTPTTENGTPSPVARLAVGQVVAIEAGPSPRGLTARSVAILHALAGPVTRVDPAAGTLEVMGRPVLAGPEVSADALAGLRVGTTVQVSGLRNAAGTVVASRVAAAPGLAEASVIGEVAGLAVAGLPVRGLGAAPAGTEALVRGEWTGKELRARDTARWPSRPFAGRVDRVSIEARLIRDGDGTLRAGGYRIAVDGTTRIAGGDPADLRADRLVRIEGAVTGADPELRARRIDVGAHERPRSRGAAGRPGSKAEAERSGHGNGGENADRGKPGERREGRERNDGHEAGERIERPERPERAERAERGERPDRVERSDGGHRGRH